MNIYLLIDTSRSMAEGNPNKLDYAKKVAAALGYIGLKNLDRVGGAAFSARLQRPLALGRGRKQILRLFSYLNQLSCAEETQLRSTIHAFTNLFPHPGFVVIVSDLFDPSGWRPAFEELTAKRYQLLVVHIVDQQEVEPDSRGDVALVDVESGRERKFFLDDDLLRRFHSEIANYFKDIETSSPAGKSTTCARDPGSLRRIRFTDASASEQCGVSYALGYARSVVAACRSVAADRISAQP